MDKTKKISLIAMCITPIIIYQWYAKVAWLYQFEELRIFSYTSLISFLYFGAYFLVYKGKYKLGMYAMWSIYIVHGFIEMNIMFYIVSLILSLDLWVNIIMTLIIYMNKNKQ